RSQRGRLRSTNQSLSSTAEQWRDCGSPGRSCARQSVPGKTPVKQCQPTISSSPVPCHRQDMALLPAPARKGRELLLAAAAGKDQKLAAAAVGSSATLGTAHMTAPLAPGVQVPRNHRGSDQNGYRGCSSA